jgi:hypothetical protein
MKDRGEKKFVVIPLIMELSSQKYGFGIQGSKRHRIPDTDPQHCLHVRHLVCVVEEHLTHLVDRDCGVDGAGQTHLTHQVRQCP